jgi:signal transduction histidine kinase
MALSVAWMAPRLRSLVRPGLRAKLRGRISLRGLFVAGTSLLTIAVLLSAAATFFEHRAVTQARDTVTMKIAPAQQTTDDLLTAFVGQETTVRAYLLSGAKPLLAVWTTSHATVEGLENRLAHLVSADTDAHGLLAGVKSIGHQWRHMAQKRINDVKKKGPISAAAVRHIAQPANKIITELQKRVNALSNRLDAIVLDKFDDIATAQQRADISAIVAVALALLTLAFAATMLRRMLTRPLEQLVTDVVAVADGVYDHPIRTRGPREVVLAARAVGHMRDEFMGHTRRLVDAQRQVTIQDERERMAADLHDLTLQDVYAMGLTLDSVRMRHPELAEELDVLIEDTRRMDRELRAIVFAVGNDTDPEELTTLVTRLAIDSRRVLGFAPAVHFQGAVDSAGDSEAARQLLMALRESLSNIGRHAEATAASITVALTGGPQFVLRMIVIDNGVGPADAVAGNGMRNLVSRAERRGGRAAMTPADGGGAQIDWWVPINR